MDPKLRELHEQREKLFTEISNLRKLFHEQEERWQDAEQEKRWETVNAEYDDVMAAIDAREKELSVENRFNELEEQRRRSDRERQGRGIPGLGDDDGQGGSEGGEATYQRNAEGRYTEGPFRGLNEDEVRAFGLQGFFRSGAGEFGLTDRHREAMRHCNIDPWSRSICFRLDSEGHTELLGEMRNELANVRQPNWRSHLRRWLRQELGERESRAMSGVLAGSGGVYVPSTLLQAVEVNRLAYGGLASLAETIVTDTGEEMSWPTLDDTANSGEQIGENTQQNDADPATGAVKWGAYEFSSKIVKIPRSALTDWAVNLVGMLGNILGVRIGRVTSDKYVNGSGAGTAFGLLNRATLGKTSAAAGAITGDEIIDLQGSLDPAYAMTDPAFMMHKNVLTYVRKLKDLNNNYIWQRDFRAGTPDTLAGDRVVVDQAMPSTIATGIKTITYGDHFAYKIRRVRDVVFLRLDERFAEFNQVAFLMIVREDGNLLDAGTAPVKYLQQT